MLEHYYSVLNIPVGSDEDSIRKAYRQMALRMHPDVNDSPDATRKFQEICEAYEVLLSHSSQIREAEVSSSPETEITYNWEVVIREAQRRARARARMRYEKIKAEQELFEKPGLKDFIVFMKYLGSIFAIAIGLWLVAWPIYTAVKDGFQLIVVMFLFWVAGFLILRHIYYNRKKWFKHGKINLNFNTIRQYFDFSEFAEVKAECGYCRGHKGTGRPFKFSLVKVRDIRTRNDGPLQHYVAYKRTYKELHMPRSIKAFYVHFVMSFIKPLIIIGGIIFIPFPSVIWRFFISLFTAILVESVVSGLTRTRTKTSFLLTPFQLLKIIIWILVILTQTYVYPGFIMLNTDILILLAGIMLIFLDMFLDLLLRVLPFYSWFYMPIRNQLPGIDYLFRKGYQPFLDIPVWSTLYPFFRWLF